jgi:phytoene synthase
MAGPGDAAFVHCRRLIAQADKARYWATLYAPEDRRDPLFALYAFDLEVAAIGGRVREPMAGEIRLQWWREVLEGKRAEEAAANPVAAALLATLQHHGAATQPLLGLTEARRFDVYDEPMQTVADLEAHGRATAGAVVRVAAQFLGVPNDQSEKISSQAGLGQIYLEILLSPTLRATYIPNEILAHYGAERGVVAATFELRAALAEMRLRARRHLDTAAAFLPRAPRAILPALLPAALIKPTLARMEKPSYDPMRPPQLSPLRRQWIIWRAARNPQRIFS